LAAGAFGTAASAQIAPPGGMAPYTVPPEAATAGAAAGTADRVDQNPRCYWQQNGRSARQEHCDEQPPAPAKK
jgi:hypothetical protein